MGDSEFDYSSDEVVERGGRGAGGKVRVSPASPRARSAPRPAVPFPSRLHCAPFKPDARR